MVVKINRKPIKIEEEPEKAMSIPYLCVSGIGMFLALWIMDLVCFTFLYVHPFPFTTFITKLIAFIGGL